MQEISSGSYRKQLYQIKRFKGIQKKIKRVKGIRKKIKGSKGAKKI
jgi:hypothetical protein